MPVRVRVDVFRPVLLDKNSKAAVLTTEQTDYLKEILQTGASDQQFANKMYDAITHLMSTGPYTQAPEITSLTPSTGVINTTVPVKVTGKNFTSQSVVMLAGVNQQTTYVSPTELDAELVLPANAGAENVAVLNEDAVMSDPKVFTITASKSTSKTGQESSATSDPNKGKPVQETKA